MELKTEIWANPVEYLRKKQPDLPVLFCAPAVLHNAAQQFLRGFPGLVTYAVKANPDELVLSNFAAAGITTYDVASPEEMRIVRSVQPDAVMHYNNPIRSISEIEEAVSLGVVSYSVDAQSELDKLTSRVPQGVEIAVRFKLPVEGAAYNFGSKFGATPEKAISLLKKVASAGYSPALTFHPGTQCKDPMAWKSYIEEAARISKEAGVDIKRLNVGGGFPSHRNESHAPQLETFFDVIRETTKTAFGDKQPDLICEPGRALSAEGKSLAVRVKAIRDHDHVFLNDGIYGTLAELPVLGAHDRVSVISPEGVRRTGSATARTLFGPTCDSLDKLPEMQNLPADLEEGDYLIFKGFGAYSCATVTRFNGYGVWSKEVVISFD